MSERVEAPAHPWPGPLRHRGFRRVAVGCAVVYAVYVVGLGLVAPWVGREPVEKFVGEWLGVGVSIERIAVDPFGLEFELTGIGVTETAGGVLISADRLWVNLDLWKSLTGTVRIGGIGLESPSIRAEISDQGELNLVALLPEPAEDVEFEADDESDGDGGLFPVRIDEIHVTSGVIELFDSSRAHDFSESIVPIELSIFDISTVPDETGRVQLEATTRSGVRVATGFDASLDPLAARGDLAIEGIRSELVGDYLGPAVPVRPTEGELDIHADFAIELRETGVAVEIERGGIEARGWKAESDLPELSRIGLDRFAVEDFRLALAEKTVHVGSILLEHPYVDAVLPATGAAMPRADAADTSRQVDATSSDSEPGPGEGPSTNASLDAWRLDVDRFAIDGARVSVARAPDRDVPLIAVSAIDFEARDFSWGAPSSTSATNSTSAAAPQAFGVTLSMSLPEVAASADAPTEPAANAREPNLEVEGQLTTRPPSARLDITLSDAALAPWSPLVGFAPGTHIASGRLDLKADVDLALPDAGGAATGSARSDVVVRDFALIQPAPGGRGKTLTAIGVQRLTVEKLRVADAGGAVVVATIRIDGPAIDAHRDAGGRLNLEGLMAPSDRPRPQPDDAGSARSTLDIRRVEIRDGRLDYRDASTARPVVFGVTQIEGVVERKPGAIGSGGGHIDIRGRVDGSAPIAIAGDFPGPKRTVVALDLEGLAVTSIAPYFEQYAGSEVEQGKLYLDLDYTLDDRELEGRNHLRFDHLVFGARTGSKDALKLPVPLAFKLMTDTQGQAEFGFDIAGDLDDPGFDLRRLVTTAFIKVIQRSLSSPLAVLQTAIPDLSADHRTQIGFAPGVSTLDAAERDLLTKIATLIASKPGQRVGIKGRVDPNVDGKALDRQGGERSDEALRALGQARARAIVAEFVDALGLEGDRIYVQSIDLAGSAVDGKVPVDVVLTDD